MNLPVNYNVLNRKERRAVRNQYIEQQSNLCSHCNERLDDSPSEEVKSTQLDMTLFPDGFLRWPVHLHHCHETGMTIGAVHSRCNAVLWQYHGE